MRTITNDYRDAQILDLGSGYETGPFLITQMGVAPNDPVPKTKMFVLRCHPSLTQSPPRPLSMSPGIQATRTLLVLCLVPKLYPSQT